MKRIQLFLLSFLFIGGSIPQSVLSDTVVIENSSGESIEFAVDANDRFLDVLDRIQSYFQQDTMNTQAGKFESSNGFSLNNLQWNLVVSHAGLKAKAKATAKRDYHEELTSEEKDNIAFIVKTLAWDSVKGIWDKEKELKKRGDKIDHVHPLNFARVVFSKDELIAGVTAIKERTSLIKNKFFDGLTDTLEEEGNRDNLLQFVGDFAKKVKLEKNEDDLYNILKKGRYKDFVDLLIELKPREGADRHNM